MKQVFVAFSLAVSLSFSTTAPLQTPAKAAPNAQAGTIAVAGDVNNPGIFWLRRGEKLTAAQALKLAGGIDKDNQSDIVLLLRRTKDNEVEQLRFSFEQIDKDAPVLQDSDVVYVPRPEAPAPPNPLNGARVADDK